MSDLLKTLNSQYQPLEMEILSLISNTKDGMFANDESGRILVWNRTAEAILGFSAHEVLGKACYDIVSGREFSGIPFCFKGCSVVAMVKSHHAVKEYTMQVTTKSAGKVWIRTSILVLSMEKWQGQIIVHLFHPVPQPVADERAPAMPAAWPDLSPREQDVLSLLAQCLVAKEIGAHLNISTETARTHIQRILKKLKTHSKLEAVIIAMQNGLIDQNTLRGLPE